MKKVKTFIRWLGIAFLFFVVFNIVIRNLPISLLEVVQALLMFLSNIIGIHLFAILSPGIPILLILVFQVHKNEKSLKLIFYYQMFLALFFSIIILNNVLIGDIGCYTVKVHDTVFGGGTGLNRGIIYSPTCGAINHIIKYPIDNLRELYFIGIPLFLRLLIPSVVLYMFGLLLIKIKGFITRKASQ